MTTDGKFESIEDFSKNATWDDILELFEFYCKYLKGTVKFPTKEEPNPKCRFQFLASEAKQEMHKIKLNTEGNTIGDAIEILEEIVAKKKLFQSTTKEKPPLKFVEGRHAFTKRSVMMTEDHWHRLQKLYDMYPIMNKHYVFQALLEDALSRLGV